MLVSLIVAMDEDRGIGKGGKLPWHLSSDLKRFKQLTMGHFLIQGRKTYATIGRPLPGRRMVIVTRDPAYQAPGCQVVHSLDEALKLAEAAGESEAFIGGGGEIFAQALPLADRLYLTRVHAHLDCEVFFPPFEMGDWKIAEREFYPADEQNEHPFTYQLLVRVNYYAYRP